MRHFFTLWLSILTFPAFYIPANWSRIFMSRNFHPCKLVPQIHVSHFQSPRCCTWHSVKLVAQIVRHSHLSLPLNLILLRLLRVTAADSQVGDGTTTEPQWTTSFGFGTRHHSSQLPIGNESVPIQLAQCWFPGLATSNAKI